MQYLHRRFLIPLLHNDNERNHDNQLVNYI